MSKQKANQPSPKKAIEEKPLTNRQERVAFAGKAHGLLTLGDGLRGSPLVAKVMPEAQERSALIELPSLDEEVKERLRKKPGKAAVSLSGDDLSKICLALWLAMTDLDDERRERLGSLATRVSEWVRNSLSDVARQNADSPCAVSLSGAQRRVISEVAPQFAGRLMTEEKSARKVEFTLGEWDHILQAVLGEFSVVDSGTKRNSLQNIITVLVRAVGEFGGPVSVPRSERVFPIKITLVDSKPAIWRRIQVKDCTLDQLHEHIQTAMGWTNSHLHHFRVGEQHYGDPELMRDNFAEMGYRDSTATNLSDILPDTGQPFRFRYEYDFGDSWEHEILVEKVVRAEPKAKYPLCLEGARACPPEDVGGVWGYADFVEAIRNPEDERHAELLEWAGGRFDPEAFDPTKATKRMRRGLPDWREWV